MTDTALAEKVARELLRDHDGRVPFVPFAERAGVRDVETAYAVQDCFVRLLRDRRNVDPVGYKIGLTSLRMQTMCGIDHPIAGVVLSDRVYESGAVFKVADYVRFGIEFEIAVKLGKDLPAEGDLLTVGQVAPAIAGLAPSIEIIDDRGSDYSVIEVRSMISDNSWNAGIMVGGFRTSWPDPVELVGTASVNKTYLDKGTGRDVLGHPFNAIAWLAHHLSARGQMLRAGDIVTTGSIIRTQFPVPGSTYDYDIPGLGSLSLQVV